MKRPSAEHPAGAQRTEETTAAAGSLPELPFDL